MDKIREIKENLIILENLENKADAAENLYSQFPENKKIEKQFDLAYSKEWQQCEKVIDLFTDLLGIDQKAARHMLYKQRDNLKKLLWGK